MYAMQEDVIQILFQEELVGGGGVIYCKHTALGIMLSPDN